MLHAGEFIVWPGGGGDLALLTVPTLSIGVVERESLPRLPPLILWAFSSPSVNFSTDWGGGGA